MAITVGVLALQGAFQEHLTLLSKASNSLKEQFSATSRQIHFCFREVRTARDLEACDGLIIPGGESTTISFLADRSNLLEPLRDFVKLHRKPTWGTCAGLILLAESANRTKQGGQDLIGGLDVRVNRNHFGRQTESFVTPLELPFLSASSTTTGETRSPFPGIFIRAPVVETVLPSVEGEQKDEQGPDTVIAPSRAVQEPSAKQVMTKEVSVLATLPGKVKAADSMLSEGKAESDAGKIVAVQQGNVFATSFHPELTGDSRIHEWWLKQLGSLGQAQRVEQVML